MALVAILAILVAAYLLGSLPTGYLLARWLRGIDIRQYGSGGTGATNVLRTVGKEAALAVLLIDALKGALAVLVVKSTLPLVVVQFPEMTGVLDWQPWLETMAGLLALLGHSRSIWINFTGGKSAATGLGVLIALAWPIGLGAIAIFALTLATSRMVSLGSILAAIATVVLMLVTSQPPAYLLLAIAGGLYVILRHRSNIERILAGTEPRLGRQAPENS